MGEFFGGKRRILAVATMLVCALYMAGCRGVNEGRSGGGDTGPIEVTLASAGAAAEADEDTNTGGEGGRASVLLRVEGDPGTLFFGVCSVGDGRSIISGRVPKRFAYDDVVVGADDTLEGEPFSCRIQKQDEGEGNLKVILLADDTTRSVQQTDEKGASIDVSYAGPQTT